MLGIVFGPELAGTKVDARRSGTFEVGGTVRSSLAGSRFARQSTSAYGAAMTNIKHANYQDREAPAGFRARRARIGYELGSELIGASLWQLPPGEAAYPYHFHYSDEEIVIVLEGRPSLRTPQGTRTMEEGEAVRFALGEEGAHQLSNPTGEPVTFLAISSHDRPDIVVYPDSEKIGASERRTDGSGFRQFFRAGDAVDYWDGETPPAHP
jgi:uncharacterized cupin superfamily protein